MCRVTEPQLKGETKATNVVFARHIYYRLVHRYKGFSNVQMGSAINQHEGNVEHALRRANERYTTEKKFRDTYDALWMRLRGAC